MMNLPIYQPKKILVDLLKISKNQSFWMRCNEFLKFSWPSNAMLIPTASPGAIFLPDLQTHYLFHDWATHSQAAWKLLMSCHSRKENLKAMKKNLSIRFLVMKN